MAGPIGTYRPPGPTAAYRPPASQAETASNRFTSDRRWRKLRALILVDQPLCHDCDRSGRVEQAVEVHHLQSRRTRPDLALDPDNLLALCKPCHSRRTARGE